MRASAQTAFQEDEDKRQAFLASAIAKQEDLAKKASMVGMEVEPALRDPFTWDGFRAGETWYRAGTVKS